MRSPDQALSNFLDLVCREIRFKSIHQSITKELTGHIEDQKEAYIKQGLDEEAALIKAVEQMGDPVKVGKQLNQAHRPKTEWSIVAIMAVLVMLSGSIQYFLSRASIGPIRFILSETSIYESSIEGFPLIEVFPLHESGIDVFPSFILYAPAGIVAFLLMYFIDYTLIRRHARLLLVGLFAVTAISLPLYDLSTISPGFNISVAGNNVVYYAVLLYIPLFAATVNSLRNKGYYAVLVSSMIYAAFAILCIMFISTYSLLLLTGFSLIIITVAIIKGYFGGIKVIGLGITLVPAVMMLFMGAFRMPHHLPRLAVMLRPELDLMELKVEYMQLIIKDLIASAQLFGGAPLDEHIAGFTGWSTDLLLTYVIVRLGYAAGFVILAVLLCLIVRMLISTSKQKNAFGYLLSVSISLGIMGQVTLYALSNLGIILTLSGGLPLISFGGVEFIINMALIGLFLSVYRRSDLVEDKLEEAGHG